jgi:hypothetical protein
VVGDRNAERVLLDALMQCLEDHGFYRLLGPVLKPTGWRCRCGVEFEHPDIRERDRARLLHRTNALLPIIRAHVMRDEDRT